MSRIDDLELKIRQQKLIAQYQHCQVYIDNMSSGNFDKNGQMAGRSVTQIGDTSSKETRLYQTYANSTKEDRILPNYVNTAKRMEPNSTYKVYQDNLEQNPA